ncbi:MULTISPECIES: hypothetical protein [unclassified Streptomyces]|uniref:hypothetical protein n=1 Tax=unclassified Streptomyces TaxID=2593676 RepID=UPI002366A8E3|nr:MULTISPECIES: hypothetical protein [unclassified Streptomyces]MDF3143207.1 hypothetical protein [Streptomyces sp. T21Q-yed]WDF36361.1 hypothetical protein PBV52_06040 [Streptomyces sp. T12]
MAAKSARAGRQVVSCSMIRFGSTGTSASPLPARARATTSGSARGDRRATFSSSTRIAYGSASSSQDGRTRSSG